MILVTCSGYGTSPTIQPSALKPLALTAQSETIAAELDHPKFGYLSAKDRLLLRQAIASTMRPFLTVERRLPRNATHVERELGIRILTPISHWEMLRPWAALWH